jgi:diaminohydroxyphosphoribosylaminopyrimidine deaminase/5-amino-6-(5-phosphoribosylamino)uracil reductase
MRRCLDLAKNGLGNTAPNPLVGAVVVYNNTIIGEGFHRKFGEHHAEVNAIHAVKDKSLLKKSTLYVNLEPCSHTGKTPPCADLIIKTGIPEVVIGIKDPNPVVSGRGYQKLCDAGTTVISGILEQECADLNRRFITYHMKKRPFIILKWAQTIDGYIDLIRDEKQPQQPTWISNEISRMLVHKWRSEEQSIMVGTRTAMMDNPRLNVREWPGSSPLRLVIDRSLKLSKKLNLFDNNSPTVVFNSLLNRKDNNTNYVCVDFSGNFLENILNYLYDSGIQSVLVEGGRMLIDTFIKGNLWDEARVFKGSKVFGNGVSAPFIPFLQPEEFRIRKDQVLLYRNNYFN